MYSTTTDRLAAVTRDTVRHNTRTFFAKPSELGTEAESDTLGAVAALTKLGLVIEISQDVIRPMDVYSGPHINEVPIQGDTLDGKGRTALGQGGDR
jgi:hypothetical protein